MAIVEEDPGAEMHALWQRYQPRSPEDWRKVARAVIKVGGMNHPSPLFGALLQAEAAAASVCGGTE